MVRFRENRILEKNRQGKKALGCGLVFPSQEVVELIGMAGGFDYIYLDGEHGLFSPESIDVMCRVADGHGLTTTARVPGIDGSVINTFLDRGVMGIVGPHVETAEQARALVDACRFSPEGERSWGGGRGNYYNDTELLGATGGERTEFMAETNRQMLVIAQLETLLAFENLDAILGVDGIDAFAWGSNDLAQSMGYPGQPDHADVKDAERKAAERIHAAGRKLMSDILVSATATGLLLDGAKRFLEKNR